MRNLALLAALPLTLAAGTNASSLRLPVAVPNSNRAPAGQLRDGVLTIALDAQLTMWHPDGDSLPGIPIEAFAEPGRAPQVPGPLIRVSLGTQIRASIENSLELDTLVFHFHFGADLDSILIPPGATRELRVTPPRPGAFFYRASARSANPLSARFAGLLHGAMIVDSAGSARLPNDRIIVISGATDSTIPNSRIPLPERSVWALNGRSWPHTERFRFTVGDTVRWRVINATDDQHPMHLHGFYFRVDEFEGPEAAVRAQGVRGRRVVTERLAQLTTMSITWVPERAGNWLFHCHFQEHLVPHGPFGAVTATGEKQRIAPWPMQRDTSHHRNHALTGMAGLVMGMEVRPRRGQQLAEQASGGRKLRLVAVQDSQFPDPWPSLRFMLEDPRMHGRRMETGAGMSPPIFLTRGQPVSITVVNRMREPTAVHWHGIELESFFDGVAGFGGFGKRIAPIIAPNDSFEARFTPPRSGTFIYHSHVDEVRQHKAGLVGALIVRDSAPVDSSSEMIFLVKSARVGLSATTLFEMNGVSNPDTVVLTAGRSYRFRFIAIQKGNPALTVSLTARPDSSLANLSDTVLLQWRPVAKDGADLPVDAQNLITARQTMGMGETFDYEFKPARVGDLRIEVRNARGLVIRVPIRVIERNLSRDGGG